MRKLLILVVAAAALAVVGVALSSSSPNDRLASEVRVYGGGLIGPGCFVPDIGSCWTDPRQTAIDAHVEGHGTGAAYGSFETGLPGQDGLRGEITCVHVEGNRAIIGGFITNSTRPDWPVGWAFSYYVIDNGRAWSTTPDLASYALLGPDDGTPGAFPTWFPETCPSTPFADLFPVGYQNVHGDIVVQAGQ